MLVAWVPPSPRRLTIKVYSIATKNQMKFQKLMKTSHCSYNCNKHIYLYSTLLKQKAAFIGLEESKN